MERIAPDRYRAGALAAACALVAVPALGEGPARPILNFYGVPGIVDMPSGLAMPDGDLAVTTAYFGGFSRNTLAFQITPRILGTFRYSRLEDYDGPGEELYDRSFDVRVQLVEETDIWPGVAVGIQDLGGTGIYSGEYIAATHGVLDDRLRVTLGLGWGRYGTRGGFDNPLGVLDEGFETRPARDLDTLGGQPATDRWFRGDAAVFGGIEWDVNDRLTLLAEYSSDAYILEEGQGIFQEAASPFNFGLSYEYQPGVQLGAYYMYGRDIGVTLSLALNPAERPSGGGIEAAPPPVAPRSPPATGSGAWPTGWINDPGIDPAVEAAVEAAFAEEGLILDAYALEAERIEVRYRNPAYHQAAQATGRVARHLTRILPASVEVFVLIPVAQGIPTTAITLYRADIEAFETAPQNAWLAYDRATITDAAATRTAALHYPQAAFPRFDWDIGPFIDTSYFDPDQPIRLDAGVELTARYEPVPGVIVSGALRQRAFGNIGDSDLGSDSVLPRVRSDATLYAQTDSPYIPYLTGAYYFRPGEDLYGRVTGGLLEPMFGGVSAELLWHRPESPLAMGVEVAYARQRDFDQLFEFQEYGVWTGHASLYYQMQNDFTAQVDVGRYLAGDWGATFTLAREFDNGFTVGAFFTLTDVPFEDFGEGSFDKGLFLSVPVNWLTGGATAETRGLTIRPIQRDGGARLIVQDRLYETVRGTVSGDLRDGWGRFWR